MSGKISSGTIFHGRLGMGGIYGCGKIDGWAT